MLNKYQSCKGKTFIAAKRIILHYVLKYLSPFLFEADHQVDPNLVFSVFRWRDRKVTFHSKDSSVISQWVEKIQEILNRPGEYTILSALQSIECF